MVWNPLSNATWNTTVNMQNTVFGVSMTVTPAVGPVYNRTFIIGLQCYGPASCVMVDYDDDSNMDAFGNCR